MKHLPMMVVIFALSLMVSYCAIRVANAVPPAQETQLAEAYHCGMLDALQEKVRRGRACDMYKEIAKKKGVAVPP